MSLGDSFPESFWDDYANRSVQIGSVIKKFVPFTKPPKEKRFVVVAIDSKKIALAVVLINTLVNEQVNYSEELKSLHIPLSCEGRDYLDYASFVYCTDLYEEKISSLKEALINNPACLIGKMTQEDLAKVHRLIMQSIAIKPFKKKRYGFC